MIASTTWSGRRYAVLGLARSGLATVKALAAAGAHVVAWDANPEARERAVGVDGVIVHDPATLDLTGAAGLVVSPGVPLNTHPLVAQARVAGVPVIGDIELFAQARAELPLHKVVGITGTNGKSTTTALVYHILKTAGVPTLMGGNIGLPILAQEPLSEGGVYVLELSSYQIDLTQTLDCDVAVLLNITPDHLDRYDDFEAYAASKARLFEMQSAASTRIEPDNRLSPTDAFDVWGPWAAGGIDRDATPLGTQVDWPALQGPHNAQNALVAIAVCLSLGINEAVISGALRTFTGLPHRMERVATLNGVTYVDDSKATNPESTAPALQAYPRVHWIVGGRAKGDNLDACAPGFPHVVRAYTIGEAGARFASVLDGKVPVEEAGTLAEAVRRAATNAQNGEAVLLSPAAASFDQFRDYEHRGQAFREAVAALGHDPAREHPASPAEVGVQLGAVGEGRGGSSSTASQLGPGLRRGAADVEANRTDDEGEGA